MATADKRRVRVEITRETLSRLLTTGSVCAADFHCLDCESKQCLRQLCLESCASKAIFSEEKKGLTKNFEHVS